MMILLSILGALLAKARHHVGRTLRVPKPVLRPWPYFQDEQWLLERELLDRARRD